MEYWLNNKSGFNFVCCWYYYLIVPIDIFGSYQPIYTCIIIVTFN